MVVHDILACSVLTQSNALRSWPIGLHIVTVRMHSLVAIEHTLALMRYFAAFVGNLFIQCY